MSKSTRVDVRTEKTGEVVIVLSGRFDVHVYESFRRAYESAAGSTTDWTVDLTDVDYMDSAALGMLFLLKEHTERPGGPTDAIVRVANCTPEVRSILQVSNFDRLFHVD